MNYQTNINKSENIKTKAMVEDKATRKGRLMSGTILLLFGFGYLISSFLGRDEDSISIMSLVNFLLEIVWYSIAIIFGFIYIFSKKVWTSYIAYGLGFNYLATSLATFSNLAYTNILVAFLYDDYLETASDGLFVLGGIFLLFLLITVLSLGLMVSSVKRIQYLSKIKKGKLFVSALLFIILPVSISVIGGLISSDGALGGWIKEDSQSQDQEVEGFQDSFFNNDYDSWYDEDDQYIGLKTDYNDYCGDYHSMGSTRSEKIFDDYGDRVFCMDEFGDSFAYVVKKKNFYNRGELVVYKLPISYDCEVYERDGCYTEGRVIGLPGETVIIDSGKVYIISAGETEPILLDESEYLEEGIKTHMPYPTYETDYLKSDIISEGEYWILNDERSLLGDSRRFGTVEVDDVGGVVIDVLE